MDDGNRGLVELIKGGGMSWIGFEVNGLSLSLLPGGKKLASRVPMQWIEHDELFLGESVGPLLAHKVRSGDQDEAENRLRLFVDLVRVLLLAPVSCKASLTFERYEDAKLANEAELKERSGSWIAEHQIDEKDLALLRSHWREWEAQAPGLDSVLLNFERAIFAQVPAETVAWTIAALESMLRSSRDDKESAGYRIRLRAALVATEDHAKRRWWFDVIKQAYNVRSAVMHGAANQSVATSMQKLSNKVGGDAESTAIQMLGLFRSICLGVVRRLTHGQSLDKFVDGLDYALLETDVPQATNIIEFPAPLPKS